ncbi:hypothetical protein QQP08_005502 [Theobroma cacao]|nr:hypothetical protein QQP08_005502 [Theobroma cacao]
MTQFLDNWILRNPQGMERGIAFAQAMTSNFCNSQDKVIKTLFGKRYKIRAALNFKILETWEMRVMILLRKIPVDDR